MSENGGQLKKTIRSVFKFIILMVAIFFILFSVLASLGGNSDPLRDGLEQFGTEQLKRPVRIHDLDDMQFFPVISMQARNVEVGQSFANSDPVIMIAEIRIAMSFWDLMFSKQRYRDLFFRDLSALPGTIHDQTVQMKSLDLVVDENVLRLSGRIGDQNLVHDIPVQIYNQKQPPSFSFVDAGKIVPDLKAIFAVGAEQ